ncbi:unnamed protein product [Brassica oleracea]
MPFFLPSNIIYLPKYFTKMHKKPTTLGKRQKQLSAQHKPNQTKQKSTKGPSTSHIRGKKTETRLPHVFKRVRAKGHRLHCLHQIGKRRWTNTVTTGT